MMMEEAIRTCPVVVHLGAPLHDSSSLAAHNITTSVPSKMIATAYPPILSNIVRTANTYSFIKKWGSTGYGDRQFRIPRGVAVDSSGNVHVVDDTHTPVQKFNNNGSFITKVGTTES